MRISSILARALLGAALLGLAGSAGAAEQDQRASKLWIRGALTYREPVALPLDSVAVVELREATAAADQATPRTIAVWRQILSGAQVPTSFTVEVGREYLRKDRAYVVHAAILAWGHPAWSATSEPIEPESDLIGLGTLVLSPTPQPLMRAVRCGPERVIVRAGDVAELIAGPRNWRLTPVSAGSGRRYELAGDAPTTLWVDGRDVTLVIEGRALERCAVEPFRAHGNEPPWRLEIDRRIRFASGDLRIETEVPPARGTPSVARYAASAGSTSIAVAVTERRCTDWMSMMPFPFQVEVTANGGTYRGCGGEPVALLQGVRWIVNEFLSGRAGRPAVTLHFGSDGRLYGQGPCNAYEGSYALRNEGLRLRPLPSTSLSCGPELYRDEVEFFDLLRKTERFEIAGDGGLVLCTNDGREISAQASKTE